MSILSQFQAFLLSLSSVKTALRSNQLISQTVARKQLDPVTVESMWELFSRYYENTSRDVFEQDLKPKHHVILLRDSGDRSLQGFGTLEVLDETIMGRRVKVIFSGDTVIDKAYWGQSALQWAFYLYIIKQKLKNPFRPVFWFLISKGYKTYLLLSRNFPHYWPRYDRATPAWHKSLIDSLARKKFTEAWQPEKGILHFGERRDHLKSGVAPIDEKLMIYPDIRFFAEKNPGHIDGDELCCLGQVDLSLARFYSLKSLKRFLKLR